MAVRAFIWQQIQLADTVSRPVIRTGLSHAHPDQYTVFSSTTSRKNTFTYHYIIFDK